MQLPPIRERLEEACQAYWYLLYDQVLLSNYIISVRRTKWNHPSTHYNIMSMEEQLSCSFLSLDTVVFSILISTLYCSVLDLL